MYKSDDKFKVILMEKGTWAKSLVGGLHIEILRPTDQFPNETRGVLDIYPDGRIAMAALSNVEGTNGVRCEDKNRR